MTIRLTINRLEVMLEIHQEYLQIHPQHVEGFKSATIELGFKTTAEPGNVRFDCYQHADDPTRFTLLEIYRSTAAVETHLQSEHYKLWREATAEMFAERDRGQQYIRVFPD
jgi:quinol monooxygenase YgiN